MASAKRLQRSTGGNILVFLVLMFVSALMILPLIYAISMSLKPMNEFWLFPPKFMVIHPTFKNYKSLLDAMSDLWVPFTRYIFNTVFITVVGTGGHVLLSSMCAFSICKLRFRGHQAVFGIIVYSLMFTSAVTSIPNFMIMKYLGIIDSYAALILPAFSSPLGLYLMKQFMEGMVPDSLLEAAKIDGAPNRVIFFKIVMPIVRPAWLTLILFSFQSLWNTGSTPVIFSEELKSLNYAISQIATGGIARAGTSSAATIVMMAAPILVFLFTQRNVVETMATSGLKG